MACWPISSRVTVSVWFVKQFRSCVFLYKTKTKNEKKNKNKSKVKKVFHIMKIAVSLMVNPVFEAISGPGSGSAAQPVFRQRSFEGAGPVIAREAGDRHVKVRFSICVPHTRHTCWRPSHYLFEDFSTESVTL